MIYRPLKGPQSDNQYIDIKSHVAGGMGQLYKAWDTVNECNVAIKVIKIGNASDRELLWEELKIAENLVHPNIIRTLYCDETEDELGQSIYSVMEFAENGSLKSLIDKSRNLIPFNTCLIYFNDILSGLQEAHKTIIHRDLKPANILLGNDNSLQICDFGIAKYVDMLTRTNTRKGYGSIQYMAPECWLLDINTLKMDIYSLGIIFFEILTLQKPFNGPTELDYREQHLLSNLPIVADLRPEVPVSISEIIRKMTNKRIADRYNNIDEIKKDLKNSLLSNDKSNLEKVLKIAQKRLNDNTEATLRALREQEIFVQEMKILSILIQNVFDQFIKVAEAINNSPISEKVRFDFKVNEVSPQESTFRLIFFHQELKVSFMKIDIPMFLEQQKQAFRSEQLRQVGVIMQSPPLDYLEIDKIVLIGKAILSYHENNQSAGFNLLLIKENQDDIYGAWKLCKFFDSPKYANHQSDFYYAIDFNSFIDKYNLCRPGVSTQRRCVIESIKSDDIENLIAIMPEH